MDLKLSVIRRQGMVAPFINGSNIWDLSPEEWTADVQQAIIHAYCLGASHMMDKMNENVLPSTWRCAATKWPELKP